MPFMSYIREALIVFLVITNLLSCFMWEKASNKADRLELLAENAAKEAERTVKEQERITEEVRDGWKAALDVTRADWAKRMRNANVQQMPGLSKPAAGIDGIPADALAIAADCAETTLMLRDLQAWTKRQGAVN